MFAGGAAERKATGRSNHIGAQSDRKSAISFADAHFGSNAEHYLRYAQACATTLVGTWWVSIEAVAQGLLERETLGARELKTLCPKR